MAKKSVADKVAFPLSRVYLELTNHCNMACTFCPYPLQTRTRGRMEFDLLKKIVDDLAEKNITETIEIRGYGEPLMHPDWYKISRYIIDSGIKLNITTNGILLSESTAGKLAALRLDDLIISLQTPDEESFKIRKTSMAFDDYVSRIKRFIEIMTEKNPQSRIRLRFLNTLGTKHMSFPEAVSVLNTKEEMISSLTEWVKIICGIASLRFDHEQVSGSLGKVAKLHPTMVYVTDNISLESYLCNDFWAYGVKDQIKYPAKFSRCRSMTLESTLIYWNGDVTFCCADFNGYLKIGSLQESSMMDVLNSPKAARFVDDFKKFKVTHPYCQNCLGGKSLFLSATKAIVSSLYGSGLSEFQEIYINPEPLPVRKTGVKEPVPQDTAEVQ